MRRLIELQEQMKRDFPGKVEFVRADHYFNLYNEAQGLPFNLAMSAATDAGEGAAQLLDGTPASCGPPRRRERRPCSSISARSTRSAAVSSATPGMPGWTLP